MTSLIQQVAETVGVLPDATDKEAIILAWLNRAGVMLHDQYDFPGTVVEQFFCVDNAQHVVTFPWYVSAVRGVRWNESSRLISLVDSRPRYHNSPWTQGYLTWRQIQGTPLHTPQTQTGTLTFTITVAEEDSFDVVVIGQTATASCLTEVITFQPGDLTKPSINQYAAESPTGIVALKKSIYTQSDVQVTQTADATSLAVIPANQLAAANLRIQILDWNCTSPFIAGEDCVEVLYKKRFMPFVDLNSVWSDDRLVQGLVYAVKYIYAFEKEKLEIAAAAKSMYMEICKKVCENLESGTQLTMNVAPDPLHNAALVGQYWNAWGVNASYRGW
jgi:hypothetical protein